MKFLTLVAHTTPSSSGWFVVFVAFLAAAHTALAMPVPRRIVVDLGPYADAETANADARQVAWFTPDPRQQFVTLAWAALELRTALRAAGVEAHILTSPPQSSSEPTFTLHVLSIGVSATQLRIKGNTLTSLSRDAPVLLHTLCMQRRVRTVKTHRHGRAPAS